MRVSSRCLVRRCAEVIIVLMAAGTAYPRIALPVWAESGFEHTGTGERVAGQCSPAQARIALEGSVFRTMEPGAAHSDNCGCPHLHARLISKELVDDKTPWTPADIVSGEEFSKAISSGRGTRPVVLQVGIEALYRDAHIPDAIFAGPAGEPEGMAVLKAKAGTIARSKEVVIYCGCCPWRNCPNIRPAFVALKEMGFKKVKLLNIPTDFQQDWVNKRFPTAKS